MDAESCARKVPTCLRVTGGGKEDVHGGQCFTELVRILPANMYKQAALLPDLPEQLSFSYLHTETVTGTWHHWDCVRSPPRSQCEQLLQLWFWLCHLVVLCKPHPVLAGAALPADHTFTWSLFHVVFSQSSHKLISVMKTLLWLYWMHIQPLKNPSFEKTKHLCPTPSSTFRGAGPPKPSAGRTMHLLPGESA